MMTSELLEMWTRNVSCSERGVRKSNSPLRIMVGVLIDGSLRRQRLEVEKGLHKVLQRIDIVDKPALPLDRVEVAEQRLEPGVREIHRQQQILQIACAAEDQAGAQRIAKQHELRRQLGEGAHGDQSRKLFPMLDCVAQCDQAAEADAAEEHRAVAEFADQQPQRLDLVVLADEELRLVGGALAEQIERCDTKSFAGQRVAMDGPQLRILCKPVDQNIGRGAIRAVQLITDTMRAMRQELHSMFFRNPVSGERIAMTLMQINAEGVGELTRLPEEDLGRPQ